MVLITPTQTRPYHFHWLFSNRYNILLLERTLVRSTDCLLVRWVEQRLLLSLSTVPNYGTLVALRLKWIHWSIDSVVCSLLSWCWLETANSSLIPHDDEINPLMNSTSKNDLRPSTSIIIDDLPIRQDRQDQSTNEGPIE